MSIRKIITINDEPHTVFLMKNKSSCFNNNAEFSVYVNKGKDMVYSTCVEVKDDVDKYINAIKIAVNNYVESKLYKAYIALREWDGQCNENKVGNLEIKVNATLQGQDEIKEFVDELENHLKNMKVDLKITQ